MNKKVIFTILWAAVFPSVYLVLSMLMFAVLGEAGFQKAHPSNGVMLLLRIWAWLFWLSPVIALVLSIFGQLPGTRCKTATEAT